MRYRIKVVPHAEPNADGEWIEVEGPPSVAGSTMWCVIEQAFRLGGCIPADHHMVSYERIK